MKKILFLVDYDLCSLGGAQKSTVTCIKQMMGVFECHVLSPETKNVCTIMPGLEMHYFKKPGNHVKAFFSKLFWLVRTAADVSPDYIHAQFSQIGLVLMLYSIFLNRSKAKCIFTDRHFFDAYDKKHQWCFRHLGRRVHRVVCTTEINANRWKEEVPGAHISIIPNVLDDTWRNYDRNEEERCKVLCDSREFVVGFVGRFVSWKRWDVAYEIAKALDEDNVKFLFIMSSFNIIRADLLNYVEKLKENIKNVEILIDADQEKMSEAYYRMDLFVLTSENESFGRTLIEAMSRRTVVIGSDSGGAPEVIGRKENLFPTGCATEAVKLIRKFENNKELCDENKDYGLERVAENYSLEAQRKLLMELYEVDHENQG